MSYTKTVTIIGAGLGGSLMAIFLARRGYEVSLYERRPDMRVETVERGRSINMTLAARGVTALREAGLADQIMPSTIPLRGRMIHSISGALTFQPYGKDPHEVIYAIQRNDLNSVLMDAAEAFPNVKCIFNKRCIRINKAKGVIYFYDERSDQQEAVQSDIIIGADGTASIVLQEMQRGERASYQKEPLDWGYKELFISPGPEGKIAFDRNALHVWPRGECMLMAIPNDDESLTATFTLPFEGNPSFSSLDSEANILRFFKRRFRDAIPVMPELVKNFQQNPTAQLYTTRTSQWYYRDRIVLLGDACHTVVPFYGQGMNAAFEDCSVLDRCMSRYEDDLEKAFAEYQKLRKRNTDAIADLSLQNFVELRDKVKSSFFVARKKVDIALHRMFPNKCVPIYTLITHTTMPYADALETVRRRNRLLKMLGIDLLLSVVAVSVAANNLLRIVITAKRRGKKKPGRFMSLLRADPFKRELRQVTLSKEKPGKGD